MSISQGRASAARRVVRVAGPVGLGAICLLLLREQLAGLEAIAVLDGLRAVRPVQWIAALAATCVSFWAIGRYDEVIHRSLRTGVDRGDATRAGAAAIALSQVLGLGVLTGALARWRMLPGLSPLDAARVSGAVAVSFLAGWAVVTAAAALLLPQDLLPDWTAIIVLAAASGLALAAVVAGDIRLAGRRLPLPSLPAIGTILALTALDTAAAALALQALMPAATAPGLEVLLPAYLLALGAALLSGTPGGVGPFELALLALLPSVPEADLIAGIVAFRLVYYALPACLALIAFARPAPRRAAASGRHLGPLPPAGIAEAARAELGVTRQNGAMTLSAPGAEAAVIETRQSLTLLFAPVRGPLAPLLPALAGAARDRTRLACAYKLSARDACAARAAGWHVVRIADEMVIDPQRFSLDRPALRQVRRKLRKSAKAGLVIRRAEPLPNPALADLDRRWRAAHGRARGVTMGVYCPSYLRGQRLYTAETGDRIIAFVTFHEGPQEWTLDLIRHAEDPPEGTVAALIAAAIEDARAAGLSRLSLAALPAAPDREGRLTARLRRAVAARHGAAGLARFKTAFAPRRAPLYAAAPSRAALVIALADLALAVHKPPPPGIAFAPAT